MDGSSTSSHDNKKFRARSMEKQRGMAFGFRKTATALKKKTGQIDSNKTSLINVTFMITKLVFVELLDDSRFVDILPNKDSFSIRNALQSSDRHPDSYSGHKMLRAGGGGLLYKMLL